LQPNACRYGPGSRTRALPESLRGSACASGIALPAFVILALVLLVLPAGAALTMAPVTGVFQVGDTIHFSGISTDSSTVYLFVTGPYLDLKGVILTNTSQVVDQIHNTSVSVGTDYTWSYDWDTSDYRVNIGDGIFIVYASTIPLNALNVAGNVYASQNVYVQGRLAGLTTPTTEAPTPVPTWAPPPAGEETMVSTAPSDDYPGRFDGNLIVYEADRGEDDADIYAYDISTGRTIAVAVGPAIQSSPAGYGNRIVYSAYEKQQFNQTDADIYIYDVTTGLTERLTLPGDQLNPCIYGDLLAWQDEAPGRSSISIVLYDLATGTRLKVPARTWAYSPDLSGGKVIWIDDPVAPAVYVYDVGTEAVQRVTNKTGIKGAPAISGDRITWADTRNDYAEVYALALGSGTETQVTLDDSNHFTPAISGDLVTWVDFRNGNRDIYAENLASGTEIAVTTAEGQQIDPHISGCTIAWADERNGSYDVYYKQLDGCTPAQAPAPVSLQPEVTEAPTTPPTTSTPGATRTTVPLPPLTYTVPPTTPTKSPGFGPVTTSLGLLAALVVVVRLHRPR